MSSDRWFLDSTPTAKYPAWTRGNAAETAEWARAHQVRSLIVVTSAYHMPRALAELGRDLPDVATLTELGVKDADVISWFGLIMPAGVPADIAREAMTLAAAKLPIKTRFIQRIAE